MAALRSLSGSLAGVMAMTMTYPLSTLSILQQTGRSDVSEGSGGSWVQQVRELYAEKGVGELYAGLQPALFGIAVSEGVFYLAFSTARSTYKTVAGVDNAGITPPVHLLLSAVAGAINVVATNPIWVLNNRCITDEDGTKAGLWARASALVAEEGMGGLYAGLKPSLLLVVNPIITYTLFESLKPWAGPGNMTRAKRFLLGAFAKTIATIITYPYVMIKSRMQMKKSQGAKKTSAWDILREIYARGGVRALYAGIIVKLVQSVSRNALLFLFEDEVFKTLLLLVKLLKLA